MQKPLGRLIVVVMLLLLSLAQASQAGSKPTYPSWSSRIDTPKRFTVLTDGFVAVLDNETGLVWEQFLGSATYTWSEALIHCYRSETGQRMGWRLPTIEELASLVDPQQSAPALPAGHPFMGVQSSFYWSATTDAGNADNAWHVNHLDGNVSAGSKSSTLHAWCVRGGHGIDGVQ